MVEFKAILTKEERLLSDEEKLKIIDEKIFNSLNKKNNRFNCCGTCNKVDECLVRPNLGNCYNKNCKDCIAKRCNNWKH